MSLQVYINGKFFDKENATVNVYDHGLLTESRHEIG